MRLLLDTHIWLWSILSPAKLKSNVASALEDAGTELWLSPVSVWETLILAGKGRLQLGPDPADWIARQLRTMPMRDATLTRDVAVSSRNVEVGTEDPVDRFLAATAVVYDLTLVTADRRLMDCPSMQVLANR